MLRPNRTAFYEAVSSGAKFIPVACSWPADLETPLTIWLKIAADYPSGVLLESVTGGETLGRWSVIACNPLCTFSARGNELTRRWRNGEEDHFQGNPLDGLRRWLSPLRPSTLPGLPSLGQLYGVWGYELIQWIEPNVPVHKQSSREIPDGIWMLMDSVVIFDQVKRLITVVAYGDLSRYSSASAAWNNAYARISELRCRIANPLPLLKTTFQWNPHELSQLDTNSNRSRDDFETCVERARKHIAAGDIFQLVISQRLETRVSHDPLSLYRSLRMVNPSPYMAFFNFGDWQLIGSSPEVMVKAEPVLGGTRASLRPIAGTRPRGQSLQEDNKLEVELLADPKERAEHVMLVDLGRNDLGRVCIPGSISVRELMVTERYSHVIHIVSDVEGLLKPECDVWDLLAATFPAGTVSGAPKIRAMQLIYALEPDARGPYSGIYGSIDLTGALNTAITIRSMVVRPDASGQYCVQVQAGAGIVADSVAGAEYKETLNKARGMLVALACLTKPGP